MRYTTSFQLIAVTTLVAAGCSFVDSGGGEGRLVGRWGLHKVTYAGGIEIAPFEFENDFIYTVIIREDGELTIGKAFDGCNFCEGSYRVHSANSISISAQGPCTEIACSDGDPVFPAGHESHGAALSRAKSYELSEVAGRAILSIYFEDQHGAGNWLTYRLLEE